MKEKINCPICRKRAFDIRTAVIGEVWIELKCPHCRNIVQVCYMFGRIRQERSKENII